MKYTCDIEINAPLEKVVPLWDDELNYKEWQDGFKQLVILVGKPKTVGAKSKIVFGGKQKIELIETIIVNNLPQERTALYEHVHMTNTQTSRFKSLGNNKTLYTSEVEYTAFNGFMIKLIAKLFPGKFKAQSQKWMKQFKAFVEKQP
jgi:uncharacterized membrane protein